MIHIYSHNDLDGWSAAAIVFEKFMDKSDIKMNSLNYSKSDFFNLDDIESGDTVYVLDYNLNNEQVARLKHVNERAEVIWIDHHAGSHLNAGIFKGTIATEFCGAALTWKYFYPNEDLPEHLVYVNDHDLFLYQYTNTAAYKEGVCVGKKIVGIENGNIRYSRTNNCMYNSIFIVQKACMNSLHSTDPLVKSKYHKLLKDYISSGKMIRDYIDNDIASSTNNIYKSTFEGYKCLVINKSGGSNLFRFHENIDDADILVSWTYRPDGLYKYSLYSAHNNVNVAKICEKYGGGGHFGAAGFSYNELLFKVDE